MKLLVLANLQKSSQTYLVSNYLLKSMLKPRNKLHTTMWASLTDTNQTDK